MVLDVTDGEYEVIMLRHFFGHASTHAAQEMHRRRSISHDFFLPFHEDRFGGAFFLAQRTKVAFLNVYFNTSAGVGIGFAFDKWI